MMLFFQEIASLIGGQLPPEFGSVLQEELWSKGSATGALESSV
jgi:hypothetical protein